VAFKGLSIHLGLNSVDPDHYGGWSGQLSACEADAEDMADLAKAAGFCSQLFLTAQATRQQVLTLLDQAAKDLKTGDILFLTFSGHGGQLPDKNGDEPDGEDETWCLFDGELVDDELYSKWSKFAPGVRILVLSDSCHSGSVVKFAYYQGTTRERSSSVTEQAQVRYRVMPPDVALRTYKKNRAMYDPILSDPALVESKTRVKASVLLISGCQDNQLSADGTFNGLFTGNLLRVWNQAGFQGDYSRFHSAIVRLMPPDQTPNLFTTGVTDPAFLKQRPFSI
jgi:hypothetical protein